MDNKSGIYVELEKQPLEIQNSAGNLKIPLANGNVMNIPLSAINISEEVNKTGIWKQVNETNALEGKEKKKSPKGTSRFKKKKQAKKEEKREDKIKPEKRLSICKEEEDEGITIKYNNVHEKEYWRNNRTMNIRETSDETPV